MTNQIKLVGVRVYVHALRMAIEARDIPFAVHAAAHLSKMGHDDAARRCIHMCMFRLGVALLFPYLVQVVGNDLERREYQGAISIVAGAPRTPFVLHFVHLCAARFHTGRVPGDVRQATMFQKMLALCGEAWRSEAESMLRGVVAEENFLKVFGKEMHMTMCKWRANEPHYAYGHWKYVATTILAFVHMPNAFPCNHSNSSKFGVPKDATIAPAPLPCPSEWPPSYHMPARRHVHWGWTWATDREPRTIQRRLGACGDAAELLAESKMSHACSSWELAHERFFEHNTNELVARVQKHITVYNIADNPLMRHFPGRTAFAVSVPELLDDVPPERRDGMLGRALQGFEFVTMVHMRTAEEAADVESVVLGAQEFLRRDRLGGDINLELLPVFANERVLFAGYYPVGATTSAPAKYFKLGHLLEPVTGLRTYENSFWAEIGGLVRWFPYGEHRYAVPRIAPIPAEAVALAKEIKVF